MTSELWQQVKAEADARAEREPQATPACSRMLRFAVEVVVPAEVTDDDAEVAIVSGIECGLSHELLSVRKITNP